jgi:hypothetical protein
MPPAPPETIIEPPFPSPPAPAPPVDGEPPEEVSSPHATIPRSATNPSGKVFMRRVLDRPRSGEKLIGPRYARRSTPLSPHDADFAARAGRTHGRYFARTPLSIELDDPEKGSEPPPKSLFELE